MLASKDNCLAMLRIRPELKSDAATELRTTTTANELNI